MDAIVRDIEIQKEIMEEESYNPFIIEFYYNHKRSRGIELMFHFFKRAKKTNPTLEEQIHVLLGLGITFTDDSGTLINNLLVHYDRESYEENPFYLLITVIGADLLDENENEIRMSYDVWSFDAECIEDENIYTILLRHFVNLAKGELPLENIESNVDFDEQEVVI